MSPPAIGLLKKDDQDNRLELILRRLGYQVFSYTRCHLMVASLAGHGASMALINRPLSNKEASIIERYRQQTDSNSASLLLCGCSDSLGAELGCDHLTDPFDIPLLHHSLQRRMTQFGRKKLRAAIRLPALVCDHDNSQLGEVNVLGTGGAQLQSSARPLREGERFEVVIPLLGKKKELEIACQVIYAREPGTENNFHYQAGVEFISPGNEIAMDLENYLSQHLLSAPDDNGYFYQPMSAPTSVAAETPVVSSAPILRIN